MEAVQKDQDVEQKGRGETIGLGLSTNGSAELHRVKSDNPQLSSEDPEKFASLNHAVTAPPISPNVNLPTPLSPPLAPPTTPFSPAISKKDKAKEEKERRAAEKEKEKVDKQKKKEEQRKQDADLKAAMDASKLSKTDDDTGATVEPVSKENAQQNGTALAGLDRFRRSKSLRFSSLSKRDRPVSLVDETNTPTSADQATDKDKEKKNRFSIRKKSFGMLSS